LTWAQQPASRSPSYTFWRAFKRPARRNVVLAGLTLGLALGAKISTAILLPAFVVLGRLARTQGTNSISDHSLGAAASDCVCHSGVTLWAIYKFEVRTPPGWTFPFQPPAT